MSFLPSWVGEAGAFAIAILRERAAAAKERASELVVMSVGRELGAALARIPASVRGTADGVALVRDVVMTVARALSLTPALSTTLLHAATAELIARDLATITEGASEIERKLGV